MHPWNSVLRRAIIACAAILAGAQLFVPPVIGLADQGDYARMIGRFGYGPENRADYIAFVPRRFIPDPSFRVRDLEYPQSEYLFTGAAVLLNRVVSRDGPLNIEMIGAVHFVAFLLAFARLLAVLPGPDLWFAALLILTDAGYVAYWNSFYGEPASCIFFLLLLAETIAMVRTGASRASTIRWSLWATLFVGSKFQNFAFAIVLAPLVLRLGKARLASILGSITIVAAALVEFGSFPKPLKMASTYNALFLGILPESKNPAADLAFLRLDPNLARYSGTGAWSPGSGFLAMVDHDDFNRLTPFSVARFWLAHPTRIWRRIKTVLPVAFSLRPEWCGNFERVAGKPPGARTTSFRLWSTFHERIMTRFGKFLIVLLLLSPGASAVLWFRFPRQRVSTEYFGLLSTCCLMAFLLAICGDAWDNVKHLFLFNLLLDSTMVFLATSALSAAYHLKTLRISL